MNKCSRLALVFAFVAGAFAQQVPTPAPGTQFTGVQNAALSPPIAIQLFDFASDAPITLSGTLPAGLTFTGSFTGAIISGTPTVSTPSPVQFGIVLNNEIIGTRTFNYTIYIAPPVSVSSQMPLGAVNSYYQAGLQAVNGSGSYIWTDPAAASLPPGLVSSSGYIYGTPTQAGTFTFPVQVRDAVTNQTASGTATIVINGPLTLTPRALPTATRGQPYTYQFTATGGIPPYFWMWSNEVGPPGWSLSSSGVLTGTPTSLTPLSFSVTVYDSDSFGLGDGILRVKPERHVMAQGEQFAVTSTPFTLAVFDPLVITTTVVPSGTQGAAYPAQQLTASGGEPPYTWSGTGVPTGMTLSPTGVLSGTPQAFGTFAVQAQASDSRVGGARTATTSIAVVIAPAPIAITTTNIGPATVGQSFSQQLTAAGGQTPYSWTLASGTLPPGLSLSSSGLVSGTPQTAGSYPVQIQVRAAGAAASLTATAPFTIVVNPPLLTITTLFVPGGPAGSAYSVRLQASGGTPPYRWSVAGGALPPGLTLSSSGDLTGAPGEGVFAFTARVNDSANQTATRLYNVQFEEVRQPLGITDVSLPEGMAGRAYGGSFGAAGGTPPYNFSINGLPPGLRGGSNGFISGTPARFGTFSVSVEVNDSRSERVTGTFTLVIRPGTIIIDPETVSEGRVGSGYGVQFSASGGVPPYRFSSGGSLPAGLTFTGGGAITGTPTEAGNFQFSVLVVDSVEQKGERNYTMVVRPGQLQITTTSLPDGQVRLRYASVVSATGGVLPYTWAIAGLPSGVGFDAQSGAISGTPTESGDLEISAQVTDKSGLTASRSFKIKVRPPLILTGSLPSSLAIGAQVSSTLGASGGLPPYSWSSDGSLPPGVSFSGGSLSGSATSGGSYSFTVRVTDTAGATAEQSTTVTVGTPLRITTQSLASGTIGTAYSGSFGATGGREPYRWAISGLPAGLTAGNDGSISGTPTAGGSFTVSATVTDSSQPALSASASVPLSVAIPQLSNLTIGGVPDTPPPAQQSNVTITLGQAFPAPITGTITLTFAPDAANNADDPSIRFSTGGRSTTFTIPAGSTAASFATPTVGIQTGTVAGVITLTTTLQSGGSPVTCNCPLTRTIRIARSAPTITSVRVTRTSTGFNVVVTGFSTTREISQGVFRFGGTNLQTNELTVQLGQPFTTWFQSAQSAQFGGQFVMTMPFNVSGDTTAVTSVTVTLTNAQGTSQPATANF